MISVERLRRFAHLCFVGFALSITLLWLLSGCAGSRSEGVTNQAKDDALPGLIAIIDDRYGVKRAEIDSNGRTYFLSDDAISVVDGLSLVKQIFPPNLNESYGQHLADIGIDSQSGVVYAIEWNAGPIHVVSNTVLISTLVGIVDQPRHIVIDAASDEVYVFHTTFPDGGVAQSRALILKETQKITDIALPLHTKVARYNPVDGHIYVASNNFAPDRIHTNALLVIDDHRIITTVTPLDKSAMPVIDMAINPTTGDVYVLLDARLVYWDRVHAPRSIDLNAAGYRNFGCLTVNPNSGWAYVCSWMLPTSHVLVVDKDRLVAAIPIAQWPSAIAVDPRRDYVYVAHYDPTYLSVIRGAELITKLDVIGYGASAVVMNAVHDLVYVLNADDGAIDVFGFGEAAQPASWFDFLPFVER